jgi:hypothetical protein
MAESMVSIGRDNTVRMHNAMGGAANMMNSIWDAYDVSRTL